MGLSKKALCKSISNSIEAAYIGDEEKNELKQVLDEYLDTTFGEIS